MLLPSPIGGLSRYACEEGGDLACHAIGRLEDLGRGVAPGLEAGECQAAVALAVVLESGAASVVGPAVDFDDQVCVAPEEVGAVAGALFQWYPGVDLGLWKTVAFDYCEEALPRLRCG
jgi:hypothetical protein